jgi:emfourin
VVINFESGGGFAHFPGLSRPVRIDTGKLAPEQADRLEGLVQRANFFEQPSEVGTPPPGAADLRSYTITVQDGDRTHTVQTSDALTDPALRDLVEHLRTHQRAQV